MNFKIRDVGPDDAGLEINDMREINISRTVTMDSHRFAREKEYWLNQLSAPLSKSSFPADWRLKAYDCELAAEHFQVSLEVFNRLMKLSKGNHYTLYIILVTALAVLRQRYSGCTDIIVGMPVYQQDSEKNLANTVVALRSRVDLHMTFKQLLMQVRQTVIEADQHQAYPIEALLKQLGIPFSAKDEFPLFDTAILLENIQNREYIRHIHLNMIFCFHRQENSMQGVLEYNPSLYREETVKRIIRHFNCLLEQLLEDANHEISSMEILSKEEKEQLLYDFNDTVTAYPFHQTAAELFALQVERTPDQIALVGQIPYTEGTRGLAPLPDAPLSDAPLSDFVSITYRELNRKSNQLAHFLRSKGIKPGAIVGLLLERTIDIMTAILGVIKAGGAYLPTAPDTPPERTRQILEDAGISILLTHLNRQYGKNGHQAWQILMMDEPGDTLEKQPQENPSILNSPSDPVYTIFTSGSSGTPKGVLVEHRNLHNLVKGLYERIYRRYPNSLQVAVVSPYIFDASVKQLFGALLLGHSLHIVPEDTRADGYQLLEYFKTHQIELTDGTPTHLRLLVGTGFEGSGTLSLKHLLIGGEPLPKSVVKEFCSHFPINPPVITNVYGPTECSVDVTSYEVNSGSPVPESWEIIPIGRPWPNHQCYIFEMYHPYRLQPPGAAGELCISGDSTARGYLNNPELTAEKFCLRRPGGRFLKKLPPWTPRKNFSLKGTGEKNNQKLLQGVQGDGFLEKSPPGRRRQTIYRTGDLARWLKDGNIAFLGRKDRQVKVRGYRIELEEIEARLLGYSAVKEAIVVVKQDVQKENYLCAYIVWRGNPGNPFDIPVLRKYLSGIVPGYMIPGRFVQLESVPLTPNGKVNRNALPEPKISDAGGVYQPPREPIEEKLVQIWAEILNIDPEVIGIDNDFFQLGGHSLKATILIAKIHKAVDIRIPLQKIFQIPCIRQMAAYIKSNKPIDRFALIKPAPKQDYYQLSSSQKRLYFIQQMDVNNTAYNLVAPVMLEGVLNPERLEHSFRELVRRHDSLRTSFEIVNHEPMQKISPEVEFSLGQYEIEEDKIMDFIEAEVTAPFDLSRAPLGRAILLKIEAQRHILVVTLHHIISDGTSQGILLKEFMTLYQGGQLPPLRLQYKDFSQWQNSKEQLELAQKQEETWLKRLQGELPTLDLPTDFPRPRLQSFEGDVIRFRITKEKMRKITGLINREGVTLYMFLLAVFNVFLFKITGQEDILVGTPVANRRHADLQPIVGLFVNIVVMRNFPTGDQTFTNFLKEVRKITLEAFENQDYKFGDLVDRVEKEKDPGRNPLFDVSFALQNMELPEMQIRGLKMTPIRSTVNRVRFDLNFMVVPDEEEPEVILEYCTKLFKEETIRMFIKNFNQLITAVLENQHVSLQDIQISSGVAAADTNIPRLDLGF